MTNSRATCTDLIRDLRTWDRDPDLPLGPDGLLRDSADMLEAMASVGVRQETEIERLRGLVAQWETNCTGRHGSQNPCGFTADHELPNPRIAYGLRAQLLQMEEDKESWRLLAETRANEIGRLTTALDAAKKVIADLRGEVERLRKEHEAAWTLKNQQVDQLERQLRGSDEPLAPKAPECICKGCPVHGIPKHMTAEKSDGDRDE